MQTFTELESQAAKMMAKVTERRKEGKEGLLDYIKVNPEEFPFIEAHGTRYNGMFECIVCEESTTICKHNPFLNGTIPRHTAPIIEVNTSENAEVGGSLTKAVKVAKPVNPDAPKGKRGKPRTALYLTPELIAEAIAKYKSGPLEGKMVAIATEMNLAPLELSAAFKEAGLELKRGKRKAV